VPTALAVSHGVKSFNFSWGASAGATSYKVSEDIDGAGGPQGFVELGTSTSSGFAFAPTGLLHTRLNARYAVQACNSVGCSANSAPIQLDVNAAIGYFKASNAGSSDWFGSAIALSADGTTLAVGAKGESSSAMGVNGDAANDGAPFSGAVYVFAKAAGVWTQQAYLKASNTGVNDGFGGVLAISGDGTTLAVGAGGEGSGNGLEGDDLAPGAGAVYVFKRTTSTWAQQAYLKASNMAVSSVFGRAVSMSTDGSTLAVGASGVNTNTGAVYVFTRAGVAWTEQIILTASNAEIGDLFGIAVALSGDGNTLAVGAMGEDGGDPVINGDQANNGADQAGAVYVFTRLNAAWTQQAYLKASNAQTWDLFGTAVALSGDGNTLAVGATGEAGSVGGINGAGSDNGALEAGAVYVFARAGTAWTQQAYVKASNPGIGDDFGWAVALSTDGNTLAVGADAESGASHGLGGDPSSDGASTAGAAYVFKRSGAVWTQQAYIKAPNAEAEDRFGTGIALSGDGNTLAVGALDEDSSAKGINGNQGDNTLNSVGAVYLY
jgi:hypothetical protein